MLTNVAKNEDADFGDIHMSLIFSCAESTQICRSINIPRIFRPSSNEAYKALSGVIVDRPYRILLVDDRPEELRLLMHALNHEKYQISIAMDGEQGLARARSSPPDLIVLDVKMPRLNGLDVLRSLRSNAATASVPVIFLSVLGDLNDKLAGFELGAVDYVAKPYDPDEMAARIAAKLRDAHASDPHSERHLEAHHTQDAAIAKIAEEFIQANLAERQLATKLQRSLGVSEKRLNAIFISERRQSLAAYISAARFQTAQALLRETDISISDIAEQTGHSSAANFTTSFGQKLGKTPAAFRRNERETRS